MKLEIYTDDIADLKADAVVIFKQKGRIAIRGMANNVNKALEGKISEMTDSGEFEGNQDQFMYFFSFEKYKTPRIGLVGFDVEKAETLNGLRSAAAQAVKSLRDVGIKKVALIMPSVKGWENSDVAMAIVEGMLLGLYKFEKYLTKQSAKKISKIILVGEPKDSRTLEKAILFGEMLSSGVLLARDIANEPSNVLTPSSFASIYSKTLSKVNVSCRVMDHAELKREGMGLIHGVGKGSANDPRFVVAHYKSAKKYPTIGIVGKGITFDSGGYNAKPSYSNYFDMKRDMSGAAAVLGLMYVIGQLKPKINVVAAVPMAENMIDAGSYKPGDILVSYSGKTVEIFNTDAEGRLIMADALSYIQQNYKLDYLVDVATLTGAAVQFAGPGLITVFANDDRLHERVKKAGLQAGEETVQVPLHEGYSVRTKSHFADLKNLSYKGPGLMTSALFLKEFIAEDQKWCHLDIAPNCSQEGEGTYKTRGATGVPVSLLTRLVLGLAK